MNGEVNSGTGYSCSPINSGRSYAPAKKSPAVIAKERARAAFVRPDTDALDRFRKESPIIEIVQLGYRAANDE